MSRINDDTRFAYHSPKLSIRNETLLKKVNEIGSGFTSVVCTWIRSVNPQTATQADAYNISPWPPHIPAKLLTHINTVAIPSQITSQMRCHSLPGLAVFLHLLNKAELPLQN